MTAPEVGVGWQAADGTRNDDLALRRSYNELAAARFLAPVLRFHEQENEREQALVRRSFTLRRLRVIRRGSR